MFDQPEAKWALYAFLGVYFWFLVFIPLMKLLTHDPVKDTELSQSRTRWFLQLMIGLVPFVLVIYYGVKESKEAVATAAAVVTAPIVNNRRNANANKMQAPPPQVVYAQAPPPQVVYAQPPPAVSPAIPSAPPPFFVYPNQAPQAAPAVIPPLTPLPRSS
jgi:hypothetical protein